MAAPLDTFQSKLISTILAGLIPAMIISGIIGLFKRDMENWIVSKLRRLFHGKPKCRETTQGGIVGDDSPCCPDCAVRWSNARLAGAKIGVRIFGVVRDSRRVGERERFLRIPRFHQPPSTARAVCGPRTQSLARAPHPSRPLLRPKCRARCASGLEPRSSFACPRPAASPLRACPPPRAYVAPRRRGVAALRALRFAQARASAAASPRWPCASLHRC